MKGGQGKGGGRVFLFNIDVCGLGHALVLSCLVFLDRNSISKCFRFFFHP